MASISIDIPVKEELKEFIPQCIKDFENFEHARQTLSGPLSTMWNGFSLRASSAGEGHSHLVLDVEGPGDAETVALITCYTEKCLQYISQRGGVFKIVHCPTCGAHFLSLAECFLHMRPECPRKGIKLVATKLTSVYVRLSLVGALSDGEPNLFCLS